MKLVWRLLYLVGLVSRTEERNEHFGESEARRSGEKYVIYKTRSSSHLEREHRRRVHQPDQHRRSTIHYERQKELSFIDLRSLIGLSVREFLNWTPVMCGFGKGPLMTPVKGEKS